MFACKVESSSKKDVMDRFDGWDLIVGSLFICSKYPREAGQRISNQRVITRNYV